MKMKRSSSPNFLTMKPRVKKLKVCQHGVVTTIKDMTDRSRTKRTATVYCAMLTRFNNGP